MRIIPTRIHGMLDDLVGIVLILAPYLLGFADGGLVQYVPQALGVAVIGRALLTDYEGGVVRLIPMPVHLMLDLATGVLLAGSPWLFGVLEMSVALLSRTTPAGRPLVSGDVPR